MGLNPILVLIFSSHRIHLLTRHSLPQKVVDIGHCHRCPDIGYAGDFIFCTMLLCSALDRQLVVCRLILTLCQTLPVYLFLYTVCVTRATIVGVTNGSVVDADTVISCVADNYAYPSPEYIWINHADGNQSRGQGFTLSRNTRYKLTCKASNHFDIPACYATDYVEVNSKLLMLYSLISAHK